MEDTPVNAEITERRQTRHQSASRVSADIPVAEKNDDKKMAELRQTRRRSTSRVSVDTPVTENNDNKKTVERRQTRRRSASRGSVDTPVAENTKNTRETAERRQTRRRSTSHVSVEAPVAENNDNITLVLAEKAERRQTRRQSATRVSVDTPVAENNETAERRQARRQSATRVSVETPVPENNDKTTEMAELRQTRRRSASCVSVETSRVSDETPVAENNDKTTDGEKTPRQIEKSRSRSPLPLKEVHDMQDNNSKESLEISDSMPTIEEERNSQRSRSNSALIMPQIPEDEEDEITLQCDEASPESPPYASQYGRALRRSIGCRRSIHSERPTLVNKPFMPYATASYLNQRPTLKRRRSPSPVDESNTVKKSRSYLGRVVGLFRSDQNEDINKDDMDVPPKIGCAIM